MDPLDSSFLQTSEKPTKIGKGFSCWPRRICFAAIQKSAFCILCRKASGSEECMWLQRAQQCLPGKRGKAVPRRERQEHSLVNVNGLPNSNLRIFNRMFFKHTRERSEKGQKCSLIFEGNKTLCRHFLSIWAHILWVSWLSLHSWILCNNLPHSAISLVVHHHYQN